MSFESPKWAKSECQFCELWCWLRWRYNLNWIVVKLARDTECPEFSISSFSSSCLLHWVKNLRLKLGWVRLRMRWWFALVRPAPSGRSESIPYYTRLEFESGGVWLNVILVVSEDSDVFCRHFFGHIDRWHNTQKLLGSYHTNVWVSSALFWPNPI